MGWRWLSRMRTALWMLLWLGVLTASLLRDSCERASAR